MPAIDLTLPLPERRRIGALAGPWRDLAYVPGPGFSSPLAPGEYRSTVFVTPATGQVVRVSSFTVPAFGGELCRIRLEPVEALRPEALGSFFTPERSGLVFAFSADRRAGAVWPPAEPGWSYDGPSLALSLGALTGVRVLREEGRDGEDTWRADRGLILVGSDGDHHLLLAIPDELERVLILPSAAGYRPLVDPAAPERPGAGRRELLGYGDRPALALALHWEEV